MSNDQHDRQAEAVRAALSEDLFELSAESIYEWGPVFKARLAAREGSTVDAVVKPTLTNPARAAALGHWQRHLRAAGVACVEPLELRHVALPVSAAGSAWMAYPWVEGTPWVGTLESIAAAGGGLGSMHRESSSFDGADLPHFEWPVFSQESVDEDIEAIEKVCNEQAAYLDDGSYPLGASESASRWVKELTAFHSETLPAIRDAGLPTYAVSLDYRATNLIYPGGGQPPVFVDFENGEVAPRLLDLAGSVLLFASEANNNPGRLFTEDEWTVYVAAYLETAPPLTQHEIALWPEALKYMRLEWGTWHLTEGAEWDYPGEGNFLRDLLTLQDSDRFPLHP
ncbi:phosphotransferase enzyme family protein [Arthrobacter rhombi]|uniref:phosphotransferase enzyme family protein n=1 Tax=Arthrobacter rhombi TaxID=71253 RepID=UPI003FD05134